MILKIVGPPAEIRAFFGTVFQPRRGTTNVYTQGGCSRELLHFLGLIYFLSLVNLVWPNHLLFLWVNPQWSLSLLDSIWALGVDLL